MAARVSCGDGAIEPAPPPPISVPTTVTVSPDRAALVVLYNATDGPNWVK